MKTLPILASLLLAAPLWAEHHEETQAEVKLPAGLPAVNDPAKLSEAGFVPIFNGKDLTGWRKTGGTGEYEVKDGTIRGFGENIVKNTFLRTDEEFGDFIFTFEMKMVNRDGNSGCMFRAFQKGGKEDGRVTGYQCEHDDWKQPQRGFTAGIYDEARRGWLYPPAEGNQKLRDQFTGQSERIFKWDDWNTIVIKCEGNHLQTWLNGELRADFTDTDEKNTNLKGFIALQVHNGEAADIQWKNLYLKKL